MASFYAELHLNGRAYPVRLCHFALHQDTDGRGRVVGKVRQGPLGLTLDVPDDDELLAWAAAPHKPLAGEVAFFDLAARVPHETLAFTAGQCVTYREAFGEGDTGAGAYVCQLLVTAPAFELRAGGPAAPLAAAVRQWAGGAEDAPTPGLTSTPVVADGGWL
ncbi:MAG TPA: type VI secretion system tube protein TssD, partial [Hymenobacter sp.]